MVGFIISSEKYSHCKPHTTFWCTPILFGKLIIRIQFQNYYQGKPSKNASCFIFIMILSTLFANKKMTNGSATCLEIVLVWQESKETCMKITKCNRYILTHPELLHQILAKKRCDKRRMLQKTRRDKMKSCKLKSPQTPSRF